MADFTAVDEAYAGLGIAITDLKAASADDETKAAQLAAAEAAKVASADALVAADSAAETAAGALLGALSAVGVSPPAGVVVP